MIIIHSKFIHFYFHFNKPLLFKSFKTDIVLQFTLFWVIALIHSRELSSLSAQTEQSLTPSIVFIVKHVENPFINFRDSLILLNSIEPWILLSSF